MQNKLYVENTTSENNDTQTNGESSPRAKKKKTYKDRKKADSPLSSPQNHYWDNNEQE